MSDAPLPTGAIANVRAVRRAAAILKSFLQLPQQTLAEVCAATGLDKGTTRRLIITLMDDGFIVQNQVTRRYGLGPIFKNLALSAVGNPDLRAIAGPLLAELTEEFQVTAFLSVWQQHGAVCLDRIHGFRGFDFRWWSVGGVMPPNCGAASKLLLAYQPEVEIERILSSPLAKMTPNTETDPDALRIALSQIRARGGALAVDDVALGLAAVAAPVFARNNPDEPICAISVAGLTPQICVDDAKPFMMRLQAIATTISHTLT